MLVVRQPMLLPSHMVAQANTALARAPTSIINVKVHMLFSPLLHHATCVSVYVSGKRPDLLL